jgi:hypothetical protein
MEILGGNQEKRDMDRAVNSWSCFWFERHVERDCLRFNYVVRVITVWAICQFVVKKLYTFLFKLVRVSISVLIRSHDAIYDTQMSSNCPPFCAEHTSLRCHILLGRTTQAHLYIKVVVKM